MSEKVDENRPFMPEIEKLNSSLEFTGLFGTALNSKSSRGINKVKLKRPKTTANDENTIYLKVSHPSGCANRISLRNAVKSLFWLKGNHWTQ